VSSACHIGGTAAGSSAACFQAPHRGMSCRALPCPKRTYRSFRRARSLARFDQLETRFQFAWLGLWAVPVDTSAMGIRTRGLDIGIKAKPQVADAAARRGEGRHRGVERAICRQPGHAMVTDDPGRADRRDALVDNGRAGPSPLSGFLGDARPPVRPPGWSTLIRSSHRARHGPVSSAQAGRPRPARSDP
jgi:hypothetical protein